jgi:tetratricopeptide (TPR) repeat protein
VPTTELLSADGGPNDVMEAGADKPDIPDFGEDDPWQVGLEALEAGDIGLAQDAFQAALSKEPFRWGDFIDVVNNVYFELGPGVAADLLDAGLRVMEAPDTWDRSWLGWMRMEAGQYDMAYDVFRQLIKDYPNFWEGYSGFISAAFEMGNEREAIDFLEGLRERFPDEINIPRAIAEIYTILSDYRTAILYYEDILALEPEDPWVYLSAAEAYYYAGKTERAISLIDKVVEYGSMDGYVLEGAANLLVEVGEYKRAEDLYRDSIRIEPDNGYAYVGLVNVLIWLEKNWDEIPGLLERAERIADEWDDAWLLTDIGWAYIDFGDCDNAIRVFEKALEIDPELFDAQDGVRECGG